MFAQLKLLAGLALVVALAAAGWHYHAVLAERDAADQRAEAAERVAAGEKAARAKEQATARSDNAAAAAYQKELENGKIEQQGAVARLRAQLRLRDQRPAGGGNLLETSAGAGQRDGEASAEFSGAQREKLAAALERFGIEQYSIASDSDKAAKGLGACQVILSSDRAQ
ncbi:hypothetical protein B0T40_16045 [Chromobacterium haemolyticum]|uniref:hypothetical protein n=1 Tax=Chromobacterium haemolyticum TaxID=394935 RepID=UPI0009DA2425|nr:hypothetical protein [Chromobacterium haemolyticum]OQS34104.1 hypothetical protein B0T40_16045 [Chromobacterium haemolyticum]